ncbi:MAG: transglutaminase domain-containing protein, partial [Azoarcus sp.]|nr:transglutaminase domain-containing protein [Azoarcus sp.]
MNRRNFLKTTTLAATLAMPAFAAQAATSAAPLASAAFAPSPEAGWRTFELTSRVEPQQTGGVLRAWVPLPSVDVAEWFRPMGNLWQGNASVMRVETDPVYGASMLYAEWAPETVNPQLEIVSRFATRDRATDFSRPAASPIKLSAAEFELYTRATELLPTDGIVRDTALEITRGASTDEEKARAIYDWVVDNTFRNPKTRGCGVGDIRTMLETRDLSGKCADLNTLYVGLARAAGLPSRDVYG